MHLIHLLELFISMSPCPHIHVDCVLVYIQKLLVYIISISLVMVLNCSWNVYYHKIAQSERTFLHFFKKKIFTSSRQPRFSSYNNYLWFISGQFSSVPTEVSFSIHQNTQDWILHNNKSHLQVKICMKLQLK